MQTSAPSPSSRFRLANKCKNRLYCNSSSRLLLRKARRRRSLLEIAPAQSSSQKTVVGDCSCAKLVAEDRCWRLLLRKARRRRSLSGLAQALALFLLSRLQRLAPRVASDLRIKAKCAFIANLPAACSCAKLVAEDRCRALQGACAFLVSFLLFLYGFS
ncbi:hypothetical protein SAMN05518871_105169 [Psychrobacillus sp. OK028]|nr:hypothetical protein SAMN05518871_105169 [Psychrobacillus sp. OK028]